MQQKWLDWAKQLKAISEIGLTYSKDQYDLQRYEQIKGIANEIFSLIGDIPLEQIKILFAQDSGYATPKVDLRAGVFRDDKILLVKENEDQKWTLPGGWADVCESPKQGVEREVFEESGYQVKAIKCVAVIDRSLGDYSPEYPHHIYKIVFLCEVIGGEAKHSIETSGVQFFGKDEIPPLSVARVIQRDIELLFDHHYNDSLPTYFE